MTDPIIISAAERASIDAHKAWDAERYRRKYPDRRRVEASRPVQPVPSTLADRLARRAAGK